MRMLPLAVLTFALPAFFVMEGVRADTCYTSDKSIATPDVATHADGNGIAKDSENECVCLCRELGAQYFIYHTDESNNEDRRGLCYCKLGDTYEYRDLPGAISGLVDECSGEVCDCYNYDYTINTADVPTHADGNGIALENEDECVCLCSELEAQYFIYHTNESVNTARQGLCYCKVGNTGQLQNGVGAISGLVAQCSGDCYTEGGSTSGDGGDADATTGSGDDTTPSSGSGDDTTWDDSNSGSGDDSTWDDSNSGSGDDSTWDGSGSGNAGGSGSCDGSGSGDAGDP